MLYEKLRERQTASELVFDGQILHLYHDDITLPNGKPANREVIRHIGAVCVIPVTDDGYAVMEKQFRYPVDEVILEIPAGKLDSKDEDHEEAARRELWEETGLPAANVLVYGLEGGATVIVRPSGTEPKVKAYYTTLGKDLAEAQAQKDTLAAALKPIFA